MRSCDAANASSAVRTTLVGIGGALGSLIRYGAYRLWPMSPGGWPVPTFTVNLLGSFAIGLLYMYVAGRGGTAENARLFWMTGVLGGFTTYSAFALESALLGFSGGHGIGLLMPSPRVHDKS